MPDPKSVFSYFPFSFTDELVFYKTDTFQEGDFLRQIENSLGGRFANNQLQQPVSSVPFRFPVSLHLHYQPDLLTGKFTIRISLRELNLFLLLFVAFSVFLACYGARFFSGVVLSAGIFLYIISVHETLSKLKKQLLLQAQNIGEFGEALLWKQQQEWMKNPGLCPACGELRNPYSEKCIRCGLHLGSPKQQGPSEQRNSTGDSSTIIYSPNDFS